MGGMRWYPGVPARLLAPNAALPPSSSRAPALSSAMRRCPSPRLLLVGISLGVALGLLYSLASRSRTAQELLPQLPLAREQRDEFEGRIQGQGQGVVARPRNQGNPSGSSSSSGSEREEASGNAAAAGENEQHSAPSPSPPPSSSLYTSANPPELPRVCGSPAVDGYAHVKPKCLEDSPTNKLWWELHPQGGKSGEGLECNIEHAVSLDGLAVGWGIGNTKKSPEECCQACRDHVPGPHVGGPFGNLPCNVWVFCAAPECFEADAHHHSQGDCWLKFSEAPQSPEVNARGDFPPDFRQRHPEAPERCQWVSGVLVPPGQKLTNGTWGPRYRW